MSKLGLHILRHVVAGDAFHDAADRYPQPKCHPETRTEILEDLWNWSSEDDHNSPVLWLYGPAGSGKSAIAQSFCKKLDAEGSLGASFFFKRGHPSRGNGNKLFLTIAYQLAVRLPGLSKIVERDPTILERSLALQLQRLVIEPCQQSLGHSLVIVIDGLDECEGKDVQQEILRSIGNAVQQPPRLRFFIASRPEPHIHEMFNDPCLDGVHHPKNVEQSFSDVRTYLKDEFSRIHGEHQETMATILTPWPSPTEIDNLVEKSSGHFIYASTIIKFINDRDFRPTERLDIVMGISNSESPGDDESPFLVLDQLYMQILSQTRPAARPRLLAILAIILLDIRLDLDHIEQLLELKPGDVPLALRGLHSVLNFEQYISFHHASFRDFLENPTRSGIFYVGGQQHRTNLAHQILKAFTYTHRQPSLNRNGHVGW
ncbi:hypothetical protein B0H13DRAFT_1647773 [Mycena leptocephala]|nr:hypothetical protein B0H13DRAFT_1647773 [Mycena leptocephala]